MRNKSGSLLFLMVTLVQQAGITSADIFLEWILNVFGSA